MDTAKTAIQAKSRDKDAKKQRDKEEVEAKEKEMILSVLNLSAGGQTTPDIATETGLSKDKTGKILQRMLKDGTVVRTRVFKAFGSGGKKQPSRLERRYKAPKRMARSSEDAARHLGQSLHRDRMRSSLLMAPGRPREAASWCRLRQNRRCPSRIIILNQTCSSSKTTWPEGGWTPPILQTGGTTPSWPRLPRLFLPALDLTRTSNVFGTTRRMSESFACYSVTVAT